MMRCLKIVSGRRVPIPIKYQPDASAREQNCRWDLAAASSLCAPRERTEAREAEAREAEAREAEAREAEAREAEPPR
jgi:hypothetical protein